MQQIKANQPGICMGWNMKWNEVAQAVNTDIDYRQTFNISRTKFQNLNVSRLVLQLFLPNALKPSIKSTRIKM